MIQLIHCTLEQHGEAILAIFNDAILNTTALYEYQPRTMATMQAWFATKVANQWPVIGAVDSQGRLLGFASYGSFRPFPANKYTVEHSVYVDQASRGQGVSKQLMLELIATAKRAQLHTLVGAIDASNQVSIRLHESLGFQHAGTIQQAAFKFGRWLDLALYQLILETPARPVEG